MKINAHATRPRLMCRVVRRWEQAFGRATGQNAVTARHLCACEACQEFFADDAAFEQSLRRNATRMKTEPGVGFEQRVLRAVMETRPEPRRTVARIRGFSLAAIAAGLAVAFMVWQRPAATTPENSEVANRGAKSGKESGGRTAPVAEESWWTTLDARRTALELAEKNPLQQEIDSVYQDAQTALGFLALNFLPSGEGGGMRSSPGKRGESTQGG